MTTSCEYMKRAKRAGEQLLKGMLKPGDKSCRGEDATAAAKFGTEPIGSR